MDLWAKYVREQEALAWKHANASLQQLRDPFVLLSERDPGVTSQYPAMSQFFGVRTQIARKAAAAKREIAAGKRPAKRSKRAVAVPASPSPNKS